MSETTEIIEQDDAPKVAEEVATPRLAADIPPFSWTVGPYGNEYQALTQGLILSHVPWDALSYLRLETKWVEDAFVAEVWSRKDMEAVGCGKQTCPYCHGSTVIERPYHGGVTGLHITIPQKCLCTSYKAFFSRWFNTANVPKNYRHIKFGTLSTHWQNFKTFMNQGQGAFQNLLDTVAKYPYNCYLLAGPPGTGKSTLLTAMYERALIQWAYDCWEREDYTQAVWNINATELSQQLVAYSMRDKSNEDSGSPVPEPEVTVSKIQAALNRGFIPCLFIDEIDKIKTDSRFQRDEFSLIINKIQGNGGQVVVATNIGIEALTKAFGAKHGLAIARRLTGPRMNDENPENPSDLETGGFYVNFWRGSIEQNMNLVTPIEEAAEPPPEATKGQNKSTTTVGSVDVIASKDFVPPTKPDTNKPQFLANGKTILG